MRFRVSENKWKNKAGGRMRNRHLWLRNPDDAYTIVLIKVLTAVE